MSSGVGAGIYTNMVSASEALVSWDKEYTPNPEKFDIYNTIKEQWQEVYENQLTLVDKGLTDTMWKAPGI